MKKIALIHTVPSVYATFPDLVRQTVGEARITSTLDEFVALDPEVRGEFTKNNLNRLHMLLRCAEMAEPDVIVVTCSTLTPPVEKIRPFITVPVVTIDGAMLKKAVSMGTKITILATANSTIGPAKEGLAREAALACTTLDLDVVVVNEAYAAIKKMDKETHDKLVKEAAAGIKARDVIILAQASMAHLESDVASISGIPTLSSPKLCMEELKKVLGV